MRKKIFRKVSELKEEIKRLYERDENIIIFKQDVDCILNSFSENEKAKFYEWLDSTPIKPLEIMEDPRKMVSDEDLEHIPEEAKEMLDRLKSVLEITDDENSFEEEEDPVIKQFKNELRKTDAIPLLSYDEEAMIIRQIKCALTSPCDSKLSQDGFEAKHQLMKSNTRLVVLIALQCYNELKPDLSPDQLIDAGWKGLENSIYSFCSLNHETSRFPVYAAAYIRNEIKAEIESRI